MLDKILAYLVPVAHGQTIPEWDASSTETIVNAGATAFKDTFVYGMQVIAPYLITVTIIVTVVWFFYRLAKRGGR